MALFRRKRKSSARASSWISSSRHLQGVKKRQPYYRQASHIRQGDRKPLVRKGLLKSMGILVLLYAVICVGFFSPVLGIRGIRINNMEAVKDAAHVHDYVSQANELFNMISAEYLWGAIPRNTVLSFDISRYQQTLNANAYIKDVVITYHPWWYLGVSWQERIPVAQVSVRSTTADRLFTIDDDGVVLSVTLLPETSSQVILDTAQKVMPTAMTPEGGNAPEQSSATARLLQIATQSDTDRSRRIIVAEIGSTILDNVLVKRMLAITRTLESLDIGISNYVLIDEKDGESVINTDEGWQIRLNANEHYEENTDRLQAILPKLAQIRAEHQLQYVDLRFGDRVFYK